jgi:predicted transcriptional regulator
MNKNEYGLFCEVFGKNLRTLVMEHILISDDVDFAISDLLDEINISKPKLYEIVQELLDNGIIRPTRVFRRSQLYALDRKNPKTKIIRSAFQDCFKVLSDEAPLLN